MRPEEVVGVRIREAREKIGWSQEEFGIYLAPVLGRPWSRQAVSAAEKGQRAFTAAEILAIAQITAVPPVRLLTPPASVREVTMPSGRVIASDKLIKPEPDDATKGPVSDRIRVGLARLVDVQMELRVANTDVARRVHVLNEIIEELAGDISLVENSLALAAEQPSEEGGEGG